MMVPGTLLMYLLVLYLYLVGASTGGIHVEYNDKYGRKYSGGFHCASTLGLTRMLLLPKQLRNVLRKQLEMVVGVVK